MKKELKKENSHFGFLTKNKIMLKSKRSQVTVFVILAILIIIVVAVLFLNSDFSTIISDESPVSSIQECTKDSVELALEILTLQGGTINPSNFYLYEGNRVDYICFTEENYKRCVMQKPLLKEHVENEIKNYIEPRVKSCVNDLETSLENDGYTVSLEEPEISVSIEPGNILVENELNLVISKTDTNSYKTIKTGVGSNIESHLLIASSISNFEARYGDSEIMNYNFYYPSLKVEKKKQSDGTSIYIISERETDEKFIFAERSVAIPPGITGN